MTMRWVDLGKPARAVPLLRVFNDAWSALASFTDLLDLLRANDSESMTQDEFVDLLLICGFEDLTPYESPYEPQETALQLELLELNRRRDKIVKILGEKSQ